MVRCGDCGVKEGQLHEFGCDMEVCPFCGGQLISCDCYLKFFPGCEEGLNEEQEREMFEILEKKGRIPWINYPNICCKCGKLWPDMFMVPDEEWKKYIQPDKQYEEICIKCYTKIKRLIDNNEHRKRS